MSFKRYDFNIVNIHFLVCPYFSNKTSHKHQLHIMNTFGSITYEFFNNKKNYHFDLTGAFSNIIEESDAIEYDDSDDTMRMNSMMMTMIDISLIHSF